jgi:hypothetical protein
MHHILEICFTLFRLPLARNRRDFSRLCVLGVCCVALLAGCVPIASVEPTPTPEPLIPTRAPTTTILPSPISEPTATPIQTISPTPVPTIPTKIASATPTLVPQTQTPAPPVRRAGFGAGIPSGSLSVEAANALGLSWGVVWSTGCSTPAGVECWLTVRVSQNGFRPDAAQLAAQVVARPGAMWMVGNEPDVIWQDNVTARQYAIHYHDVYTLIKQADPTARVAVGGVSQPTPLRLRYLDQALDSYRELYGQPMPVDAWTVHMYILREERGSWGTDIPPGFVENTGELVEIDQHDDMDIFRRYVGDFRRWMTQRGYRDCELAVTEYGILMPEDYGFPPARVRKFMWATFDYFLTATDAATGLPADGNRLVQRWAWFSVNDKLYPAGDLVNPATGQLTPAGVSFAEYVQTHR